MANGICISDRFASDGSMNARSAFNRRLGGSDDGRRVEAAGGMHAQIACTTALENAVAFSTAPTRTSTDKMENKNLLPMSPDKSVT